MKTAFLFCSIFALAASAVLYRMGARAASAPPGEQQLQQQIVAKEREELDSLKAGDMERFSSLIANNAVFVDTHGSAGKDEVVKDSSGFRLTEYQMEDVRFVPVSANIGLIAYKLTESGTSHGNAFSGQVFVSALWTERQGKWVCLFSQETAAR